MNMHSKTKKAWWFLLLRWYHGMQVCETQIQLYSTFIKGQFISSFVSIPVVQTAPVDPWHLSMVCLQSTLSFPPAFVGRGERAKPFLSLPILQVPTLSSQLSDAPDIIFHLLVKTEHHFPLLAFVKTSLFPCLSWK